MHTSQNMLKKSGTCFSCHSEYTFLHFQQYCEKCKSCPLMIEEQVKIVPAAYRPNSQEYKLTSVMQVQQHLRDTLNRIGISQTQANINRNVEKILYVHQKGQNKRGYKQKCAAFVYFEYENKHKMTKYQFCKKTDTKLKKFNEKFLEYKRALQQSKKRQLEEETIKTGIKREVGINNKAEEQEQFSVKLEESEDIQQKHQEDLENNFSGLQMPHNADVDGRVDISLLKVNNQTIQPVCKMLFQQVKKQNPNSIKDQEENYQQIEKFMGEKILPLKVKENEISMSDDEGNEGLIKEISSKSRQQFETTLQKLFDKIFPSPYMQASKQKVFPCLLSRILIINYIWENENVGYPMKEYFRIPCLVFGVLISYKSKINQKTYIEAVEQILDITLLKTWLTRFTKQCKKIAIRIEGREDLTEVTSQQNATCSALNNSSH